MKTIMVTGGRGMLGHAVEQVVRDEPRAGYRFEFIDIEESDLTDKAATRVLFERVRPAGVIHLAADVGGLYKNVAHGVEMFENNLLMNMHIMQPGVRRRETGVVPLDMRVSRADALPAHHPADR